MDIVALGGGLDASVVDARIPDNDNAQPHDELVHADGAPAYFSTLPTKAMARALGLGIGAIVGEGLYRSN